MNEGFEVVAMALEPRERLERFARHYLALGASRVSIYFDGPEAPCLGDPRIRVHACGPDFWDGVGTVRHFGVEDRQRAVYRHAYDHSDHAWCLIVDIDEYVVGPNCLSRFFADLGPDVRSVRFPPGEAVFGPEDRIDEPFGARCFRLPISRYAAPVLSRIAYRGLAPLFSRGLLGHSRGKQALRTGLDPVRIDIHDSFSNGVHLPSLDALQSAGFLLRHYDAIDFAHWVGKCAGRLEKASTLEMGAKRERQLRLFGRCRSMAERRALFVRLYSVRPWQIGLLRLFGLLLDSRAGDQPASSA